MKTNLLGRRVSFPTYNPDGTATGEIVAVAHRPATVMDPANLDVWVAGANGRIEKRLLMHLTLLPTPTLETPNE